ncbi:hypothetical protein BASA81_004999 [Batrachochytrium salamandrivorans]|nr:hypothetical protein BASA81_004999 [Batrachochytrium salamandrivorans]
MHNSSQEGVYENCGGPIIKSLLDGYNATIMAYGQTGAGKTFTMTGASENYKHRGLIPRAISHLYNEIAQRSTLSFTVRISYLEVYNEQMIDLLAPTTGVSISDNLTVVEEKNGSTHVKGLKIENANNEEEALNLLFEGETNRSISEHQLNKGSTRSHCIFTVYIESRSHIESSEKIVTSKLNLVDLAGSERLSKTETKGKSLKEATSIFNMNSLVRPSDMILGRLVRAYIDNEEDELEIINLRQIKEVLSIFRLKYKSLEGELEGVQQRALKQVSENPTGSKESSFDPHLDPGLSSGGSRKVAAYDADGDEGVGDVESSGFGIGLAPSGMRYQQGVTNGGTFSVTSGEYGNTESDLRRRESGIVIDTTQGIFSGVAGGSIRERKTGATPLSRADEFEAFKCSKGAELNRILAENKLALREKRRVAKELAESVNQITQELNELKGSLDQKTDAHIKNSGSEDIIIDEDKYIMLNTQKQLKTKYKEKYDSLHATRIEVEYCTKITDQSRQKLMSEFEQWYESIYGSQNTDGGGTGVEDVLDIGEKFDILQMEQTSFRKLKDAFAQPGFLAHPNDEQPFILETDASDFAISGVLHQHDQSNNLRPVAFYSRQMNNAERNYDIYDKELLAVVESSKHWRHLLQGGLHPVTVLCDHKNLEYFMSTKKLTRRQARWSLELSEYTFTITHRPGKLNGRADSLSRREDYFLDGDQSNFQRIIDPDNVLDLQVAMADLDLHVLVHSTVLDKVFVQEADWPLIIADFLAGEDNVWIEEISEDWLELCKKELKNFRFRDNTFVRILNDGKSTATYMPSNDRVQVMKHYHESLAHLKYGSIIDLITRRFWWPDMKKDLKDYISRCPECQLNRSASRNHALPIRPVPPVALPFERWGIDFYGPMVETKNGSKYLITCIDYATRWVLAKPVREMTEAAVATFLYDLMMTYGAPFEIISDRGKSFWLRESANLSARTQFDIWLRLHTIPRLMGW